MEKLITKTKIETYNESGELLTSTLSESYTLTPSQGKVLKNIKTKQIINGCITVDSKKKADQYIEIDINEGE